MPSPSLPSERTEFRDPVSARIVVQWTASPARDQHLYFTSPSVTADNRWLVILSERGGHPNLYAVDREDGRLHALTRNTRGLRLSYCYSTGGPTGLAKSTACLDAVRRRAFVVIDDQIWRCDVDDRSAAPLCRTPADGITAFAHVTPDGRWLCLPIARPQTPFLEPVQTQREQMDRVWTWVMEQRIRTDLWLCDTGNGATRLWTTLPFWVTHVQFDPGGTGQAICNSEGPWHEQFRLPRIWRLSAAGHATPLFKQAEDEQCGHENCTPDGRAIVYHGTVRNRKYIARRDWSGELLDAIDVSDLSLHHVTPEPDGGYLADDHDGVIYWLRVDGGARRIAPVCRHDSSDWEDQDNHVHPLSTGRGTVLFTSRRTGSPNVYEVQA